MFFPNILPRTDKAASSLGGNEEQMVIPTQEGCCEEAAPATLLREKQEARPAGPGEPMRSSTLCPPQCRSKVTSKASPFLQARSVSKSVRSARDKALVPQCLLSPGQCWKMGKGPYQALQKLSND